MSAWTSEDVLTLLVCVVGILMIFGLGIIMGRITLSC